MSALADASTGALGHTGAAGGPGLPLACWELREAQLLVKNFRRSTSLGGFLPWGLTRQLSQQLLSEKGLNLCRLWRLEEAAGSAWSPLSALSCCLCPQVGLSLWEAAAWLSLLSSNRAVLWHSFCSFLGGLCSSLLLSKESKLLVLSAHSSPKRQEVEKGSGGSKVSLLDLACISGRGC